MPEPLKDPRGGLTAAGRAHFKRTEGANLKPGVKGAADTPEKMRRKGSFLTRFFTNPSGPMVDEKGKPTRLALSAAAWGEPVPKDRSDAAKLAAKGRRLLERYEQVKKHGQHDQKSHGNWARGGARSAGASIRERMRQVSEATGKRARQLEKLARDGGFTYNPKRNQMRSSGFVSAISSEYEERHTIDSFDEGTIKDYAAKHAEVLARPNHHLGAWTTEIDGETFVFLDISIVMSDAGDAADMGRQYDQLAIFDLNTFTEWSRYQTLSGEVVYSPEPPNEKGEFKVAKADKPKPKTVDGIMYVPGELLDDRSISAIVEQLRSKASADKSSATLEVSDD